MGTSSWSLWRHCCCRYGWYPALILPLVTFGCALSVYSSTGCHFVNLDIGFTPVNEGWGSSSAIDFGIYFVHSDSLEQHDNPIRETLHGGCDWHSDGFVNDFVDGDRTFKMTRYMALISCASSAVAMVTAWLYVITPLPVTFFWGVILLPAVMISFIAEGSKFLVFDTSICRNALWYRTGLLVPEKAESCGFGETAWFACAAAVLHFWALVCICVRAPTKRTLKQTYRTRENGKGMEDNNDDDPAETSDDPDLEGGGEEKTSEDDDNDNHGKSRTDRNMMMTAKADNTDGSTTDGGNAKAGDSDNNNSNSTSNNEADSNKTPTTTNMVTHVQHPNRDLAISPVDCLMEGFEVATDLAHIDVCQTMVCPTPHAVEVEEGTAQNYEKVFPSATEETAEENKDDSLLEAQKTEYSQSRNGDEEDEQPQKEEEGDVEAAAEEQSKEAPTSTSPSSAKGTTSSPSAKKEPMGILP